MDVFSNVFSNDSWLSPLPVVQISSACFKRKLDFILLVKYKLLLISLYFSVIISKSCTVNKLVMPFNLEPRLN